MWHLNQLSTRIHFMIYYKIAIHCVCRLWTGTMILWFFFPNFRHIAAPWWPNTETIWLKCCTLTYFTICHKFGIHCICKLEMCARQANTMISPGLGYCCTWSAWYPIIVFFGWWEFESEGGPSCKLQFCLYPPRWVLSWELPSTPTSQYSDVPIFRKS